MIPLGIALAVTPMHMLTLCNGTMPVAIPELRNRLAALSERPSSPCGGLRDVCPGLLRLDMGTPAAALALPRHYVRPWGASLGLLSIVLLVSIPLGLVWALQPPDGPDCAPAGRTALSTLGLAMPSFYVGSLLILLSVACVLVRKGSGGLPFLDGLWLGPASGVPRAGFDGASHRSDSPARHVADGELQKPQRPLQRAAWGTSAAPSSVATLSGTSWRLWP